MYIHLGNETVVKKENIIGIFDLDTATVSRHTRKYINLSAKNGDVIYFTNDLPKSFVVCVPKKSKLRKIYISQLSSLTLNKRNAFLK